MALDYTKPEGMKLLKQLLAQTVLILCTAIMYHDIIIVKLLNCKTRDGAGECQT